MKPSVKEIVADTGPLIALSRIDKLSILPRLFTGTLVTATVLAKRRGLLPSIRPPVEQLVLSGYYLADQVIEDALRLAGE